MKKIIIGLSGLVVLAFVAVLVVNGQKSNERIENKKPVVTHDCSKCPSAAQCADAAVVQSADAVKCDTTKCKTAKCDPATCKKECKNANSEMKCDATKCSMHKDGK